MSDPKASAKSRNLARSVGVGLTSMNFEKSVLFALPLAESWMMFMHERVADAKPGASTSSPICCQAWIQHSISGKETRIMMDRDLE